jgi:hypothetical protein
MDEQPASSLPRVWGATAAIGLLDEHAGVFAITAWSAFPR